MKSSLILAVCLSGALFTGCRSPEVSFQAAALPRSALPSASISLAGANKRASATGIRANLFGAPKEAATPPHMSPPPVQPPGETQTPAADPLANWEYAGGVETEGERLALLDKKDSREGVYVRGGDSFAGGYVAGFDKDRIEVALPNSKSMIARKDDWRFNTPPPVSAPSAAIAQSTAAESIVLSHPFSHVRSEDTRTALFVGLKMLSGGNEDLKDRVFEGQMTTQAYHEKAPGSFSAVLISGKPIINYDLVENP